MNKEYIYHDGNVILEDEKGNKSPIEYRDNLDEVLIQENVIETMENEKQELEEKSKVFNKHRKANKRNILFPFVAGMLTSFVIAAILNSMGIFELEPFTKVFAHTIFGPMTTGTFFITGMSAVFSFFGGIFSLGNYAEYKNSVKNENARITSIEYLNGALENAKEDLDEMKKQKTEENKKKGFRIVKINDSQAILELYQHIQLYYNCGYNGKKIYKYYQKHGQLPKKLIHKYNEDGQQAIIEYLEEKGPTLIKKSVS